MRLLFALSLLFSGSAAHGSLRWSSFPDDWVRRLRYRAVPDGVLTHALERRGFVTVPIDAARPKLGKLRIFYRLFGAEYRDRPLVVVINGGPALRSDFYRAYSYDYGKAPEDTLTGSAKKFRVLLLDQRGTGYSAPIDTGDPDIHPEVVARYFGSDSIARDHAAVIDAVVPRNEPFVLLGQSFGGQVVFQYLTLAKARPPRAFVFASPSLPYFDPIPTYTKRREVQRDLDLQLRSAVPDIEERLRRLRAHLAAEGLDPVLVHSLFTQLGRGQNGVWEKKLRDLVDELTGKGKAALEAQFAEEGIELLNYILSSAALNPNRTDRTMGRLTAEKVAYEPWMLSENEILAYLPKSEPAWKAELLRAIDESPPPPMRFPSPRKIRERFGKARALFTFANGDAFRPLSVVLPEAKKLSVPGHTDFVILDGGHKAILSAKGVAALEAWLAAGP